MLLLMVMVVVLMVMEVVVRNTRHYSATIQVTSRRKTRITAILLLSSTLKNMLIQVGVNEMIKGEFSI